MHCVLLYLENHLSNQNERAVIINNDKSFNFDCLQKSTSYWFLILALFVQTCVRFEMKYCEFCWV